MKVLLLITMLAAHGGHVMPDTETVVVDSMQDCMTLMSAVQQKAHSGGHVLFAQCVYQSEIKDYK